jgi:hypothetical protein
MSPRPFLLAAACISLITIGQTTGEEPQFLGRTREQWAEQLESGQRRQRSHAAWAIQEFAATQVDSENHLIWLNELLLLSESNSPSVRYWGTVGLGRFISRQEPGSPLRSKAPEAL